MLNSENKIFIGLDDIASQIDDWKEGFYENGIDSLTAIIEKDSNYKRSKIDYVINKGKEKFPLFKPRRISTRIKPIWDNYIERNFFKKVEKDCDIYFFLWKTFKSDFSDIIELKKKGKKIINLFVGDEIRWYPAMKQNFQQYNLTPAAYPEEYDISSIKGLTKRLNYLRIVEKYSDMIIFLQAPTQAQLSIRPFYSVPIILRTHEIIENIEQRKVPIVIHAPSNPNFKGTKYVLEAIERLKEEKISFEYKLIQNMPNEEILKEYSRCDILVGQLLVPGGGKQELEALAAGMVVLSSAKRNYPQLYQHNSPVIDVGPDTIYKELREIILDWEKRKELAKKGRPFVEEVHNPKKICKRVLDILNTEESERTYDYYPTFFRNDFIPESEEATGVYNEWTNYVKDCDWYKKHIKSGEREGLIF